MAYRKTLASRLFNMAKSRTAPATANSLLKQKPNQDQRSRRGFLQRSLFQSATAAKSNRLYQIRGLDALLPPPPPPTKPSMSAEELRKVLRASQMEAVRVRLREMDKTQVSYSEFFEVCCDSAGGFEQGMTVAKLLDDSGAVIVLGNVVFLRPDQVARAIESVMPLKISTSTTVTSKNIKDAEYEKQMNELKAMEEKKDVIDREAESLVRTELWLGLGLLFLQTTAFMRLTFWELSWDVMEPICFFVTSFYFMAGYAFFLRTSKDPSFEGFFQSRFEAKQKRLMKTNGFDIERFNELRKLCYGSVPSSDVAHSINPRACTCEHRDNNKSFVIRC